MYHFQLLTVLLAIGLSSQSAIRMTKLTGFTEDMCPAQVPLISTECQEYGNSHGVELGKCVKSAIVELVVKAQADKDDHDKLKKDVCDGEVVEDACLNELKAGCSADDISKVQAYMNECTEYAVQQLTGVQVKCGNN